MDNTITTTTGYAKQFFYISEAACPIVVRRKADNEIVAEIREDSEATSGYALIIDYDKIDYYSRAELNIMRVFEDFEERESAKRRLLPEVQRIVSVLDPDERQLLKDTINRGAWGDTAMEFRNKQGDIETVGAYGYCTNDAHKAGNFSGRKVSAMFRSIYRKLCPDNGMGRFISQCEDWWGDGSGDMIFIRDGYYPTFEIWAKGAKMPVNGDLYVVRHALREGTLTYEVLDTMSGNIVDTCISSLEKAQQRCEQFNALVR